MPFTFSHAAAAWPFERTRLEMSALIIGCFSPDFAYFFSFAMQGRFAHSFEGVFVLDLPLSLVAYLLFHAFIKQPATMLLPRAVRARIKADSMRFSFWPPSRIAMIVISILIGIGTHILWDSFTHSYYWPYQHWSFLTSPVYLPIEGQVQMEKALQDFSSLFGLIVVGLWILVWYRATKPHELPVNPYSPWQIAIIRVAVPALALAAGLRVAILGSGIPQLEFRPLLHFGLAAGIAATRDLAIGLLICGAVFRGGTTGAKRA